MSTDKDEAMARVDAHADLAWKTAFDVTLLTLCGRQEFFTSSDVLRRMPADGPSTHDLRAAGSRIRWAASRGYITDSGRMRNTGSHNRPQRVWRSCICMSGVANSRGLQI